MGNKLLYQFIELCKLDKDFVRVDYYKNSITLCFKDAIYSVLTEKLIKLPNSFFIGKVYDYISNQYVLQLFIYKIPTIQNEE